MPVSAVTSPPADITFSADSNLVQTKLGTAEGTATDHAGPETSIKASSELTHHTLQAASEAHGLFAQQSALPSWQSPTPNAARNSPSPYKASETGDAPAPAYEGFPSLAMPGAGPTVGGMGMGMGSDALGGVGSDDSLSGGFAFMPPAALFPPSEAPSPAAVPAAGLGGTSEPGAPAGCTQEARPMGQLAVGDSMGPSSATDVVSHAPPNAAQQ